MKNEYFSRDCSAKDYHKSIDIIKKIDITNQKSNHC